MESRIDAQALIDTIIAKAQKLLDALERLSTTAVGGAVPDVLRHLESHISGLLSLMKEVTSLQGASKLLDELRKIVHCFQNVVTPGLANLGDPQELRQSIEDTIKDILTTNKDLQEDLENLLKHLNTKQQA